MEYLTYVLRNLTSPRVAKLFNLTTLPFLFQSFHPAFRTEAGSGGHHQAMEIDQITSLVSIFSFGQHIMAAGQKEAAAAAAAVASEKTVGDANASDEKAIVDSDKKSEDDSDSESDTSSDSGHSSDDHDTSKEEEPTLTTPTSTSTTTPTTATATTKLKRSVSTPDLCSSSVSSATGINSDSPICVEVATV